MGGPAESPGIPLVPDHLNVVLCVQAPEGYRPVTDEELLQWDEPFAELVTGAIWNLRRDTRDEHLLTVDTVPGMRLCSAPDGLNASRMLCLVDLLRPWPLEGVVIACPRPDQIMVVPLDGLAALPALRVLMSAASESHGHADDALSDQLFWSEDGDVWELVPVLYSDERIDMNPGTRFMAALERLTAVHLAPVAAEA
jgi:hypothetical protein